MNDAVHALVTLPATDGNFKSRLGRASENEIEQAIAQMKKSGGSHKSRITACERELRRRVKKNAKKDVL